MDKCKRSFNARSDGTNFWCRLVGTTNFIDYNQFYAVPESLDPSLVDLADCFLLLTRYQTRPPMRAAPATLPTYLVRADLKADDLQLYQQSDHRSESCPLEATTNLGYRNHWKLALHAHNPLTFQYTSRKRYRANLSFSLLPAIQSRHHTSIEDPNKPQLSPHELHLQISLRYISDCLR